MSPRLAYVTDMDSGPNNEGGVFLVDLETGAASPIASGSSWVAPSDVIPHSDLDKLIMADVGTQQIREWPAADLGQPSTSVVNSGPEQLVVPLRFLRRADGTLLLLDGYANPSGLPQTSTGAVFEVSQDTGSVTTWLANAKLIRPSDLIEADDGTIYILDADTEEGGHPPTPTGWTPQGALYRLESDGSLTTVVAPPDWISPLGMCWIPDDGTQFANKIVVVDTNAGVLTSANKTGEVSVVDPSDPTPTPVVLEASGTLKDPVCVVYEKPGYVLIADLSSDAGNFGWDRLWPPLGFSQFGPGNVWRLELATGELTAVVSSPEFVSPTRIRIIA